MERTSAAALAVALLFALAALAQSAPLARASGPQSGVVAYVPIALTNSQSSPTPSSFQQQLTIDWSTYSSYLASDVANVEFFTTGWVPLYAWCESSCSSTSTSSAVWVNLGSSTVPASGSLTIVMAFYPTSTNDFSQTGYWGEASDLSSTYGAYDNGAKVFEYYNNGQTTTGFTVVNGGSLGTKTTTDPYSVSTGVLALAASGSTSTSSETVAWYDTGVTGDDFVVDGWVMINTTSDSSTYNANALFAVRGASSTGTTNYIMGEGWTGAQAAVYYVSGTTSTSVGTSGTRAAGWVWSTATVSGSSLSESIYTKPSYEGGTVDATASGTSTTLGSSDTYVGIANWAGVTGSSFFYQWKVRAYPPGGAMPAPSFGSVSSSVATPAAYSDSGCTSSPASFDMGEQVYGGFTVAGSGGTPWTLNYISDTGGNVKAVGSLASLTYCDSAGYTVPVSGSSGTWTLQVTDANGVVIGESTFTVNNVTVPDLPSGAFALVLAVVAVYLIARRSRDGA